jgi:hypothetical protein
MAKEYLLKIGWPLKEAEETAETQKEYAQLFYDKLAKQIVGAYKSKELLDEFINTP